MLLQWFWIPLGAFGCSGDLPAVPHLPDPPGIQEKRRIVPDRHRECRRHDRFGGHDRDGGCTTVRPTREFWVTRQRNWARLRPSSKSIPTIASRFWRPREKRASTGIGKRLEYRIKHKNGSWRVLESVASTIRDAKGEVSKLVIVNRDITERKRAEAATRAQPISRSADRIAQPPPLSGSAAEFVCCDRGEIPDGRTLCSWSTSITSRFLTKPWEQQPGDQILQEIGRRLAAHLKEHDASPCGKRRRKSLVFRLGGDEFAILLDAVDDPSDAMRVAHGDPGWSGGAVLRRGTRGPGLAEHWHCAERADARTARGPVKGCRCGHAARQDVGRIPLRSF